jgi:hypothetical protein
MALYLIETPLSLPAAHAPEVRPEPIEPLFERIADALTASGAEVIEIQAGRDTDLVYTIAWSSSRRIAPARATWSSGTCRRA